MPRSASARIPTSCSSDKLTNYSKPRCVSVATRSAHSTAEMRLSAATGGGETSCWRCLLPFGAVILVTGAVLTAVGFSSGPGPGPGPGPASGPAPGPPAWPCSDWLSSLWPRSC
ncbi:hypothetical protein WMY93_028102 [Mugilogobius chulae]|uniref:Uncharacterized protein n=1 Tax=Mugilogobius chulae TaxID=88201 RepID=A0AAW0MZH6_9GOBI